MKKAILFAICGASLSLAACKKKECHNCHYEDANGAEVELGNYCDDDLENLEKNGYSDETQTYEVHCHEH